MAWDESKPANDEKVRNLGTVIRANWEAIEQNDTGVSVSSLNQWVIHLIDRSTIGGSNTPARIDDIGMLFCKNDGAENELFYQDSQDPANEIQMSQDGRMGSSSTNIGFNNLSHDGGTTTYDQFNLVTAWGLFNSSGGTLISKGITSSSISGGLYTITFDDAVDDTNYLVIVAPLNTSTNIHAGFWRTPTLSDFKVGVRNQNGTAVNDQTFGVVVLGGRA